MVDGQPAQLYVASRRVSENWAVVRNTVIRGAVRSSVDPATICPTTGVEFASSCVCLCVCV